MWIRIHIISPPGSVSGDQNGQKATELWTWIRIILLDTNHNDMDPQNKIFKIRLGMNVVNFPKNFGGFLVFADGVKSTDKLHLAETETG